MHDSTRCVHHSEVSHEGFKNLAVPTYRASTIVYPDAKSFRQKMAADLAEAIAI
ncbi:hypothetical protein [Ochrobactrum sp. EDr1-4]|uniref:hypothetical protein n=1 Tax=Ochrobactrum sp. EDr1-4 TaxID=3368622 RepID=UPI003B9FCBD2